MASYGNSEFFQVLRLASEGECSMHHRMMLEYSALLARRLSSARNAPESAEEWRSRRDGLLARLREAVGEFPERTPLDPGTVGSFERDGYSVEKVVIQARPGWPVPLNVYLPAKLDGKAAGVLCPHGHASLGKSSRGVQARCISLARNGFVAVSLDKVGFNERRGQGHAEAHYLPVAGLSLQGIEVWDNMRALDYLASREEVNAERLGCTGSSGGGNQTLYLAALDDRVKAAVPTASVAQFGHLLFRGVGCACEIIPGVLRWLDQGEICALVAPRPLLVLIGTRDRTFPIDAARAAYESARHVYDLLGAGDAIEMRETYAPHAFDRPMRDVMVEFFDRRLRGGEGVTPEPIPLLTEPEDWRALHCFEGGRLPADARKVLDVYREKARVVRRAKDVRQALLEEVFSELPGTPSLASAPSGVRAVKAAEARREGQTLEGWVLYAEPEIMVPTVVARPEGESKATVLYLNPRGKDQALDRLDVQSVLRAGATIVSADLRGSGETSYSYYTEEERVVRNSVVLGRHVAGMRAYDVKAVLSWMEESGLGLPDAVWATGASALVALLAALLDERVKKLVLEGLVSSLVYECEPDAALVRSVAVPRMLRAGDVPDLVAACRASVLVARPVDASGAPLPEEKASDSFRDAELACGAGEDVLKVIARFLGVELR